MLRLATLAAVTLAANILGSTFKVADFMPDFQIPSPQPPSHCHIEALQL